MFECGPLYHVNQQSTADIVINQGGTDSGKTYALVQLLFTFAICTEPPLVEPIITILSKSVPDSKKGPYRLAQSIANSNDYVRSRIKNWNETSRTLTFDNGWIMEFISAQDEQTAKQGKRQYLFVNEAQGIHWLIFWQMAKRTRIRTFIDYNPTAPFWAHDNLIGTTRDGNDLNATVEMIISDHRHNPFLTEDEHRKTEMIKDKELFRVYARGLTGNLQGLIYTNWKQIPDDQFPEDAPFIGGLDFGYTNDPTAGVKIAIVGESLFIHEICYTPGITPTNLKSLFEANGFNENNLIYCDHDPDIIAQLRRLSVQALPSKKGQGSIRAGIFKLYDYNVFYTASSTNIAEERKRYMWKIDKDSGKPTNTPEDGFDHLMDAIRYGVYTHFFK